MKCKVIKDLFTEKDNQTFDIVRVMFCISILAFICLGAYELYKNTTSFELTEVSAGLTALLSLGGAVIGYKSKNEN